MNMLLMEAPVEGKTDIMGYTAHSEAGFGSNHLPWAVIVLVSAGGNGSV